MTLFARYVNEPLELVYIMDLLLLTREENMLYNKGDRPVFSLNRHILSRFVYNNKYFEKQHMPPKP
jgi:hypothetical protein